MMTRNRRTGVGVAIVLAFVAGAAVSELLEVQKVGAAPKEAYEGIKTFTNILSIIQKNYVDEVQTKQLIEGAVNGMLVSLDPHSAYLTPELYKELQVETKGSFGGLGIEITNKSGMLTVVAPIEDTRLPRRHQVGRRHSQDRRRVHQGHDARRGREAHARQARHQGQAHDQAREPEPALRLDPHARDHQDPERQVEGAREGLRLSARDPVPGAHRRRPRARDQAARQGVRRPPGRRARPAGTIPAGSSRRR